MDPTIAYEHDGRLYKTKAEAVSAKYLDRINKLLEEETLACSGTYTHMERRIYAKTILEKAHQLILLLQAYESGLA